MTNSPTHASGWAVVDDRGLQINTVSDTRRTAIVNWLANQLRTSPKHSFNTDEDIEYLWQRYASGRAQVHKVNVYVEGTEPSTHKA